MFKTMFSLPPGEAGVEGTTDECPIWLQDDRVEQFRDFAWSLYAL